MKAFTILSHDLIDAWSQVTAHALGATSRNPVAGHAAPAAAGARPAPSRSFTEHLDQWLWNGRQREFERSLASVQDVFELEARLQARERGMLRRYY